MGRDFNDVVRDVFQTSATPEEARETLLQRQANMPRYVPKHLREVPKNDGQHAELAATMDNNVRDDARRRQQKEENERIQHEMIDVRAPQMTVDDMLEDCVLIAAGSQVARLSSPRSVLSFSEFRDLTACNVTEVGEPPKRRQIPNADLWKKHVDRKTVQTRTFHAGAGEICRDPDGETAVNSWRPIERRPVSADVQPFLDHVAYLIGDTTEREVFLNWLAHIEQKPGVLPHYGWLHIATNTGTGRNWMASVLARVWRGYVAPNVDLGALLESQYNGMLAGRVLAMVDEVQEGGGENPFRTANRLNGMVNEEKRKINPKFGRECWEHNACRWLVFSNYDNALPLKDTDRRWRVIRHDAAPRSPETYTKLYALLNDAGFINAVGMYLRNRDIGSFNPGERPPMNDAKRAALNASKSTTQHSAEQLIRHWPSDVITNGDAAEVLSDGQDKGVTAAAMRRAMNEVGALQYGNGKPVKVRGQAWRCWILRNPDRWAGAAPAEISTEAVRARGLDGIGTAMDVLASGGQ
jgi:hypothetical protein